MEKVCKIFAAEREREGEGERNFIHLEIKSDNFHTNNVTLDRYHF